MIELSWTTTRPGDEGEYWLRQFEHDRPTVVEVLAGRVWFRNGFSMLIDDVSGQWAGPLEPPRP